MRKILLTISLLFIATSLFAAAYPVEIWPATDTAGKEMFSVSCSSSTATLILASDTRRVAYTISNPSDSYSVYIATYAITAAEITTGGAWHRIKPDKDYYEESNCATQAIYGLTQAEQTPIVVSGEKRIR